MNGTKTALALSAAMLFLATVASIPAESPKPSAASPVATSGKPSLGEVGSKPIDLPRVESVAQAAVEFTSKPAAELPTVEHLTTGQLEDLREAVDAELAKRSPPKAVVKQSLTTCDPNCQCSITGVCTCGPDCKCTCPKAASGVAAANPTVTYQNVRETVYETRVGPFGGMWQVPVTRVVSRPVVTSSTTVLKPSDPSVTQRSTAPVVTVQSSPAKVVVRQSTPVVVRSTSGYTAPSGSMRRVCSGGVCRLVPQ